MARIVPLDEAGDQGSSNGNSRTHARWAAKSDVTLSANARARVAMVRVASATSITLSRPKRRASHGVGKANSPINSAGIAVSNDACAFEIANSSRIEGRRGPTDTIAGHRSIATSTAQVMATAMVNSEDLRTSSLSQSAPFICFLPRLTTYLQDARSR